MHMPNPAEKLSIWLKKYEGIWIFVAALGVFISPILSVMLTVPGVDDGISSVKSALLHDVPVPVYQLILMAITVYYIGRFRLRYRLRAVSPRVLVGNWKNSWGPPNEGHESLRISSDLNYYVGDTQYFVIEDFRYDPKTNIIEFKKVEVKDRGNRVLINKVKLVDNDTLEGREQDYPVRYTRIVGA